MCLTYPNLLATSMQPMTFSTVRAAARTAAFFLPWVVLAGCTMSDADERSHAGQSQVAEGDIGRDAWSPASLSEVKGIPVATLRTVHAVLGQPT
jgi:hypothetical protein